MRIEERLIAAVGALADRDEAERLYAVRRLTAPQLRALFEAWSIWAHDGQLPQDGDWRTWLMMAGRGFGKTRAGAEWVSGLARAGGAGLRIALVGATAAEVGKVMVKGPTGLREVARAGEDLLWYPTDGRVEFSSGAQAFAFSGANPDGLRGAQHHFAWCDELAKWAYPEETWDNLMLGLRLDKGARAMITTTPRPITLLRRLIGAESTAVTRGRTADNLYLPLDFVADVTGRYGGTRLERQELEGELIEEVQGALWTRELIGKCRVASGDRRFSNGDSRFSHEGGRSASAAPESGCPLQRVVVGVDPPASANGACGIVACGLGTDPATGSRTGYVLDDRSVEGLSPEGWARAVVRAAEAWGADRVIVETNQGGEMVESVLRSVDCALPARPVWARFGKGRRAEPVSALFEAGKAKFAGAFPELEDQLCGMTAGGYEGPGRSPDRADAMVWAMAELLLGEARGPRIRRL